MWVEQSESGTDARTRGQSLGKAAYWGFRRWPGAPLGCGSRIEIGTSSFYGSVSTALGRHLTLHIQDPCPHTPSLGPTAIASGATSDQFPGQASPLDVEIQVLEGQAGRVCAMLKGCRVDRFLYGLCHSALQGKSLPLFEPRFSHM